eukprot:sb/3476947/
MTIFRGTCTILRYLVDRPPDQMTLLESDPSNPSPPRIRSHYLHPATRTGTERQREPDHTERGRARERQRETGSAQIESERERQREKIWKHIPRFAIGTIAPVLLRRSARNTV